MKRLTNLIDRFPADNKLLTTIITYGLTRGALALGVSLDPVLETIIAGLAAAAVGYRTPNEGSILRMAAAEDGNPHEVMVEPERADVPEPVH